MEGKLEGIVNYLRLVDCALNAANQNEELQDRPPQQQEGAHLSLPIEQYTKMTLRMTNSTSLVVTLGGSWCHRMIIKQ